MQADKGDGAPSVLFWKALRRNFQGRRLFIMWDRASSHRGNLVPAYLNDLNGECPEPERLIHLEYFAPNAPEQNPMEDVGFAAKRWIRKHFFLFETFAQVKHQFVNFIHDFTLKTTKFEWYWTPQMI